MELRELQLYCLDILKDFAEFCDKEGLKYYLDSGTLLGAVRHKGFIPWDDDIDVSMPIEDFKKFVKIAPKKIGDKYFVQTFHTDKKFNRFWGNLRANGTTAMEERLKNWDIHWGIEIDIFPIVGAYENKLLDFLQKKLFVFNSCLINKDFLYETGSITSDPPPKIIKPFYILPRSVRHIIVNILNLFVEKSFYKSNNCYSVFFNLNTFLPTKVYGEGSKRLFEGILFNAPDDYDALLTVCYNDYMSLPKEEERNNHSSGNPIIYDKDRNYTEYK